MTKVDYVTIPIQCVRYATEKAVQVQLLDHSEQWIPRSCLPKATSDNIFEGEETLIEEIQIARWFVDKEKLRE